MNFYAGIGSRRTPPHICEEFTRIAQFLAKKGLTLRSGGAQGADQSFEAGAGKKEIFKLKHATDSSILYAERLHPAWHLCNEPAKRLLGRNIQIILGRHLKQPVKFVIAWTDSPDQGGTRMGLECARRNSIPIFNFWKPEDVEDFWEFIKSWQPS